MLYKYTQPSFLYNKQNGIWKALIANANIGGENVHRGSVMGAIVGARVGHENLPNQLKSELHDRKQLESEIDSFVAAVIYSTKGTNRIVPSFLPHIFCLLFLGNLVAFTGKSRRLLFFIRQRRRREV